jgi:regulator of protease activity HflC (stomatin/prohibitin superfamily)
MILIVLGVIVLILALSIRTVPNVSAFSKTGILIALLLIGLGVVFSSFVQIDAGQVGVKKLFGKVQPTVLNSGLNMVNPLYEI